MTKKILIALFSFTLLFSLTGCRRDNNTASPAPGNSVASNLKSDAENLGSDIKSGAENLGSDIKSGAENAGSKIKEGAEDLKSGAESVLDGKASSAAQ